MPDKAHRLQFLAKRSLSFLTVENTDGTQGQIDELLQVLNDKPKLPACSFEVGVLDALMVLAVLAARVSRPVAYGIALAGRSRYPFCAATAQFVGLFATSVFFGITSLPSPEFHMRRTSIDYKIMRASFLVGVIAGVGDISDMIAAQFIGFGLATVIQAASRVVITAMLSKLWLRRDISEMQAWSVVQVALSITAFTMVTNKMNTTLTLYDCLLGVGVALAAALFLSLQGVAKEFFAKGDGHNVNYSMSMCLLFAGCSFSNLGIAVFQLHGDLTMFFHGWELRSLSVPVALFVMSASSSYFTKRFGALTTVLLNIFSLVSVYFSSVLFFGQACSIVAVTLVFVVVLSVLMTARSGVLAKEQQAIQTQLQEQLKSGVEVAERLKKTEPAPVPQQAMTAPLLSRSQTLA